MATIFSKIIAREIPAPFVYEDDVCVVIMDKFPAVPGQTLVIPKQEVDYIFNLPNESYEHLFLVSKIIAKASDIAFKTIRSCLVVEGFEVPHIHIKIYPMTDTKVELGLVISKHAEVSDEELQVNADKIKAAL